MDIEKYWQSVARQKENEMRSYLHSNAIIRWHDTNEQFTTEEFIEANCKYPGNWNKDILRVIKGEELTITITHIYSEDTKELQFHVVSFIRIENDKIKEIDEYWGSIAEAPKWRRELHIGNIIKERNYGI